MYSLKLFSCHPLQREPTANMKLNQSLGQCKTSQHALGQRYGNTLEGGQFADWDIYTCEHFTVFNSADLHEGTERVLESRLSGESSKS